MGDSQRMIFPGPALRACKDTEPKDWHAFEAWGIVAVYSVFPNTMLGFGRNEPAIHHFHTRLQAHRDQ